MATAPKSIDWMPAKGRHPVNIGSSLGRALKNRKNKGSPAPATKRSLPERDFYCFKFNFKASSVDTSRPATIEIKQGAEGNNITAEYPSTQPGEVHMFSGKEQTAKDVDCILIFDEETGTFTLEKLDSFVLLKYERRQAASSRPESPAPIAASSSSSAKGKGRQQDYNMDRDVSAMDEDAEGEVDDAPDAPAASYHRREEEEEEEEGEEPEIPLRQAIKAKAKPPPPPPPSSAVPARPVKPLPKPRPEAKAPPPSLPNKPKMPPPPAPVAVPTVPASHKAVAAAAAASTPVPTPPKSKPAPPSIKTKKTKAPVSSFASEEIIEFGRPTKKVRPSTPQQPPPPPPPPAPVELSLPGGSSGFAPPPAPASYRPPNAGSSSSSSLANNGSGLVTRHPDPVVSAPMDTGDSSEEDEDWEQVPTATPTIPQAANPPFSSHLTLEEENLENQLEEEIFGDSFAEQQEEEEEDDDEMVEIDPYELEAQMMEEEEEEEGEDFLNGVVSPAPQQQETRRPISMNELAGGSAPVMDSDDEFSSSDESEDD